MEQILYSSKKKLIPKALLSALVFICCASLVYNAISAGVFRKIGILLIAGLVCLFAGFYLVLMLLLLFGHKTAVVQLTSTGIQSSENGGDKIGEVPWSQVSGIEVGQIDNTPHILITVRDASSFLKKDISPKNKQLLEEKKILLYLTNKHIDMEFNALVQLLQKSLSHFTYSKEVL